MMEATVRAHDRYQVELKLAYPLSPGRTKTFYELDLYIFSPRSLGVNPETYTKQQFYTDLQAYIRIKTPSISLIQFDNGESSPLGRLRAILELTARQAPKKPPSQYESQIKLFCCIFKSAMRDFVTYIYETVHEEDREALVRQYVDTLRRVVSGYRDLQAIIQTPGIGQRTLDLYLFGDEYISLVVEDHTYHLINDLSVTESCINPKRKRELLALINNEVQYRHRRGYASIPEEHEDNEKLIFRRSVLKKYMASILFLNTKREKEGLLIEHSLLALAAAVAMIFATAVAFISQSVYGSLTLPVFVALIVSYIFKDRIKEILRFYFSRKMTRFIFDHKTRIRDAARNVVGFCKESFEFIGERKIPPGILEQRNRDHITEIENGWMGEQILLYRKRIRLFPETVRRIGSQHAVAGINDIMRLNVQEFLRKMDDPKKELFVMNDDGYHRIKGTRVYHLNLIMRLMHDEFRSQSRYRVVFNRQGIKRIEQVHTL